MKVNSLQRELQEFSPLLDKIELKQWKEVCEKILPEFSSFEKDIITSIMYAERRSLTELNFNVLFAFLS